MHHARVVLMGFVGSCSWTIAAQMSLPDVLPEVGRKIVYGREGVFGPEINGDFQQAQGSPLVNSQSAVAARSSEIFNQLCDLLFGFPDQVIGDSQGAVVSLLNDTLRQPVGITIYAGLVFGRTHIGVDETQGVEHVNVKLAGHKMP